MMDKDEYLKRIWAPESFLPEAPADLLPTMPPPAPMAQAPVEQQSPVATQPQQPVGNPFSDDRRNQMVDEANSGRVVSGIGQALSGFLAPLTGRSQDAVTNQFEGYRKQKYDNTVGQFDAKKAMYQQLQSKLADKAEEKRRWEVERAFDRQKIQIDLAHKAGQLSLEEAKQKFAQLEAERKSALAEKEFGERARHNRADEAIGWERAKNPPGLFLTPAQQLQIDRDTKKEARDFTTDKSLVEARSAVDELKNVVGDKLFAAPENSGLFGVGASLRKMAPEWAATTGLSPEQQNFIQKVQRLNVGERAKVFGASLSSGEKKSWDEASAMLSSGNPQTFTQAINTLKVLSEKALRNMESGYSDEAKGLVKSRGFESPLEPVKQESSAAINMVDDQGNVYAIPEEESAAAEAGGLKRM